MVTVVIMIKCCYYYPYYYFWSHWRPTLKADVIDTLSVAQFLCHLSRADGIVCSEDLLRSCVISNTICERLNKRTRSQWDRMVVLPLRALELFGYVGCVYC